MLCRIRVVCFVILPPGSELSLSFDAAGKAVAMVVFSYWPWRLCSLRWEAFVLIRPAQRRVAGCVRESPTEALLENLLKFTLFSKVFVLQPKRHVSFAKPLVFSVSWTVKEESAFPARRSMMLVSVTFAWSSDDCVSIV